MTDLSSCTYPVFCSTTSSCADCKQIKDLDAKIRRLGTLASLRIPSSQRRRLILMRERSLIFAQINAGRDPISSKLPVEVTRMIFEAYIGLHPMDARTNHSGLQVDLKTQYNSYEGWCNFETFEPTAYLRLGAVCQRWRQIAWGHGKLWSTVHITISALYYGTGPSNIERLHLLAEWIKRSEPHPVDIRFVHPRTFQLIGEDVDQMAKPIFKQLLTSLSRWRNTHFEVDYLFPLLDSEERQLSSQQLPSFFRCLAMNLNLSCNLTRLDLFRVNVHIEAAVASIDLLARSSSSIAHIGLANIHRQSLESTHLPLLNIKANLPSLLSLSVSQSGHSQSMAPILDRLVTPSLQSVGWLYRNRPYDGELEALISLIHRSRCSVQTLFAAGLEKVDNSDDDSVVIRLFGALPDLKHLFMGVKESGPYPSVIPCLSQKLSTFLDETLLPCLTTLFCQHTLLDGTTLQDYLPVIIGLFIDDPFIVDDKINPFQDIPQTLPSPERIILQDITVVFWQEMMEPQNRYHMVGRPRPPLALTNRYRCLLLKLLQQYGIRITLQERRGPKELLDIFSPSKLSTSMTFST